MLNLKLKTLFRLSKLFIFVVFFYSVGLSTAIAENQKVISTDDLDISAIIDASEDDFDLFLGLLVTSKDIAKKAYDYELDVPKLEDQMTEFVDEIKSMIPSDDPEVTLNAISQYLFDIQNIEIVSTEQKPIKPESVLVPFILETKKGLEFAVALLYAAVAERLNIPLKGIQKSNTLHLLYEQGGKKFAVDIADGGKVLSSGLDDYIKLDRSNDENSDLSSKNMLGFFMVKAGTILAAKKKLDEAFKYVNYAGKLYPQDAEIYGEKGALHKMMKNPDEAVEVWRKALEINPSYKDIHSRLFVHYLMAKEFAKVEELVTQLDELDPEGNHHGMLAMNYVVQNKHDKAVEHFKIEKQHNPDKENVYKNLGLSYTKLEEYDKALAAYDEAIQRFPENTNFYALKAKVYHASNNIDALILASEKALKNDPDQPAMHAFMAIGYHEKGMDKKAKEIIKETVDKYKDDWRAPAIYAGHLLDVKKDNKKARKYYKKAFKRNKNNPQLLYQLGLTYYYEKRPVGAQVEFEKGLKLFKGKQQAMFHLGLALTDAYRTKFKNAIKHYEIAKKHGYENKGLEQRFLKYHQTGK